MKIAAFELLVLDLPFDLLVDFLLPFILLLPDDGLLLGARFMEIDYLTAC